MLCCHGTHPQRDLPPTVTTVAGRLSRTQAASAFTTAWALGVIKWVADAPGPGMGAARLGPGVPHHAVLSACRPLAYLAMPCRDRWRQARHGSLLARTFQDKPARRLRAPPPPLLNRHAGRSRAVFSPPPLCDGRTPLPPPPHMSHLLSASTFLRLCAASDEAHPAASARRRPRRTRD